MKNELNQDTRILVLGGGQNQLPLLVTAKQLGYTVVLCDADECAAGVKLADHFHKVSIVDADAVLEIAKRENIQGIVGNTEAAMHVVAYVSQMLGLVGNTVDSINNLTSKNMFRQLQKRSGCYAPSCIEATTAEELCNKVQGLDFPIIIKPNKSSGTRGTVRIDRYEFNELKMAFEQCQEYSRDKCVTAEEYVEMPSLQVIEGDIFIHRDHIIWDGLFSTARSEKAPMIPMTDIFPLQIDDNELIQFRSEVGRLLKTAGIVHGEYNVEAYFTHEKKLFVIEINARQGGNHIPEVIRHYCGIDFTRLLVSTAVGDDGYWESVKQFEFPKRIMAFHLLFPRQEGIFKKVEFMPKIVPYITTYSISVEEGAHVHGTHDASSCIGNVELVFPDMETEAIILSEIEELIVPVVEWKNGMKES